MITVRNASSMLWSRRVGHECLASVSTLEVGVEPVIRSSQCDLTADLRGCPGLARDASTA